MIKKILIAESGGPTPIIDWTVAGILAGLQGTGITIYGAMNGLEGVLYGDYKGNIVDLTDVDPNQFLHNGPGAGLRTTRIDPTRQEYEIIAKNMEKLGIEGVIYVGGNDSAKQLLGLTEINSCLATIHAIKTIDNDLRETHHCPGFGSAALFNAIALKHVASDFSSFSVLSTKGRVSIPVLIYQVMGRKAGWLAQATSFARVDPYGKMVEGRAPMLIFCKEIPFDKEEYLSALESVISKYNLAFVVAQEDLTDKKTGQSLSELYAKNEERDKHNNVQHGRSTSFSTALYLAQLAKSELACSAPVKDTAIMPQHIQRSFMMSLTDASEAYLVGHAAAEALLAGETKKSVILKRKPLGGFGTALTDLANLAGDNIRQVPLEYIQGINGPTQEFVDEFISTIGGPTAIPQYSEIRFKTAGLT